MNVHGFFVFNSFRVLLGFYSKTLPLLGGGEGGVWHFIEASREEQCADQAKGNCLLKCAQKILVIVSAIQYV